MLIDRQYELSELNHILNAPTSQLIAVTGRRRLGKTTLLYHWAKQSGHPFLYWVGSHFPSTVLLGQFSRQIWQLGNPGQRAPKTFCYDGWTEAFEELAAICQEDTRHIVIIDEFPYAVTSEPGVPSALQNAWDHHLKFSNVCMVLCGSHIGMMEDFLASDAPLYGRMSGPLRVRPMPYATTSLFLPEYSAEQRVATYAILGGVPAYLEHFSDQVQLLENLRNHLFRETGLFRTDPDYLLGEQVRDLKNYQAVLAAIAGGARKPAEIAKQAELSNGSNVDGYLAQLVEMDYIRRELPVTVPPKKRDTARTSRYVITDHYLRFYFRFIRPNLDMIVQQLYDEVEQLVAQQLRAFIGMTAFEDICREWVLYKARRNELPCSVQQVGSHWSPKVQIDVAAIHWGQQALILGEAKWQKDRVGLGVVKDLLENKTPKTVASLPDDGTDWTIHHICFACSGFTEDAQVFAQQHHILLVDLQRIDIDLIKQMDTLR